MSKLQSLTVYLPTPEDTARLGVWLAPRLSFGSVLLLFGQIGSGKTHLARALIRERLGRMEDIPSPTFTLVQTYEADGIDIWHADLYRLTHPDEVTELGLTAAFDSSICIIEWPERLGSFLPKNAISIQFLQKDEGRQLLVTCDDSNGLIADMAREWSDYA